MATSSLYTLSIDRNVADQINQSVDKQRALAGIESHYIRLLMAENSYALSGHAEYRTTFVQEKREVQNRLNELNALELTPIERQEVEDFQAGLNRISEEMEALFSKEDLQQIDDAQPTFMLLNDRVAVTMADLIEELSNSIENEVEHSVHRLEKADERELWFTIIPIVLVLPIAACVIFFTITHVTKPLLRLVDMAEKITMRDFSTRMESRSLDEVGKLTSAFNAMAEEIERRYDELESFAYIVAHDLKNPIASIYGLAELLKQDLENQLKPDEKEALETIEFAAESMNTLITELLEFARAGKVELSREPVSMNDMLKDVVQRLKLYCKERGGRIVIKGDLPAIYCDPVRFTQIWTNLIYNALKYNDKPEPTVSICADEKVKGMHRFKIEDNGIGIEEKDFQNIFLPFQRAHVDGPYEGTGIGLAIVKRVIDFHRGRIWVESRTGEGTTFFLTVPKIRIASQGQATST
ncbi:sensor histidine kinase [Cerasicoccus fimbriatus]|uniref:sensor histidine kinase n=1 Tax=Cerasicoccus fimbriatus TaxID=3014554 RepID=UPI0022B55AEB|nr:HAMP domain-containing sensor histidine kinase [Cerasicoccus sp. TK19100]